MIVRELLVKHYNKTSKLPTVETQSSFKAQGTDEVDTEDKTKLFLQLDSLIDHL